MIVCSDMSLVGCRGNSVVVLLHLVIFVWLRVGVVVLRELRVL